MSKQVFLNPRSGRNELPETYPIQLVRGLLLSGMMYSIGLSLFRIEPGKPDNPQPPENRTILRDQPPTPVRFGDATGSRREHLALLLAKRRFLQPIDQ